MDNIFGNWFSFDGFTAWKLHTAWDYVYFFLIIAIGVLALFAAVRYLSKHRNHKDAVRRVAKRMERLGGRGAACYCDQTVRCKKDSCTCDLICAARDKVYVARVFHFGLEVIGGADQRTWRFRYNKEVCTEPNPLPALEEQKVVLTRLFSAAGIRNVPVETMVVFADNYGTTRFSLPGVRNAVSCGLLRKWRKDRPIGKDGYDLRAVKAAIEASVPESGSETR